MTTPNQPGWYDDSEDPNALRYWDGKDWTSLRHPKPALPSAPDLAPSPGAAPAQDAPSPDAAAAPAGWYPDPTGKPVQKYWDGEAWTDIPPPEIPATRGVTRPPVTTTGPVRQRRGGFVLAGLVVLAIALQALGELAASHILMPASTVLVSSVIVLIILIIGVTIAVRSGQSRAHIGVFVIAMIAGLFAVPNIIYYAKRSSPSSSSPDSRQSHSAFSAYYQKGYESGKSGLARRNYGVDKGNLADHPDELEHDTCSEAVDSEVTGVDFLEPKNQDDFMSGCLQAFKDLPPTGGPKPGPLNPYR